MLFTGDADDVRVVLGRKVLAAGGKLAVAVTRAWQVPQVRGELGGERVLVGCVGARDGEAAAGFVKGAEDALGPITALVFAARAADAAAVGRDGNGELAELLDARLLTGANLARAAVGRMRRRKRGQILFVASAAAAGANLQAADGALRAYCAGLSAELDASGVEATIVLGPNEVRDVDAVAADLLAPLCGR